MSTAIPVRSPLPSALSGTTAVLVGGTSGIGLAAGELLHSVGARVVLVGRDPDRLKTAVARVEGDGQGAEVLGVSADGADEEALASIFDRAGQVDHVLLTAGTFFGAGPLTELSADDLRAGYDARIWGALAVARVAATRLPAGGSITFSSGILVLRPLAGMAALIASAGAVESLTGALAIELAPARLRVNTVRYGRVDTPLLRSSAGMSDDAAIAASGSGAPLGRYATAEEAAATVLFLMANNYVTGQVFTVDGGESLSWDLPGLSETR